MTQSQTIKADPPVSTGPSEWAYDAILEGLVSGKISGVPMEPQDARLLLMLLEGIGWMPDASHLAGAMPYLASKLDTNTLRALMRNLGFTCRLRQLPGHALAKQKNALVVTGGGQRLWAVVSPDEAPAALVRPAGHGIPDQQLPLSGNRAYTVVDFSPAAPIGGTTPNQTGENYTADTFARFAPGLRLAFLLTIFSGLLTVVFSLAVIFLFDLVVSGQEPGVIVAVLVAAGALFLFDLMFRFIRARVLGRISGRFEYLLGTALFDKLLKLPGKMIERAPIADQAVRLRDLEGLRDLFAGPFAILALELPVTLILFAAIAVFSPTLAITIAAVIFGFLLAAAFIVPMIVRRASVLARARSALSRLQMEAIEKRDLIAQNGLAWPWAEKAERTIDTAVAARFKLARASAALEALSYLCLPTAAASIIFSGAALVIAGDLSGGELVAATMLTWRAVAPAQQGLLILPKTGDLLRLFRQVNAMMQFPEEAELQDMEKSAPVLTQLSASNVYLRGPNAHLPTLAGVSLDIPHGQLVSVTGASGSGKSVLLGVLAGQIRPQAGSVRLGGVSLSELSGSALGRQIVLVPQRPHLLYGTLAQNLRFVDPLISDDQIETVLHAVGLDRLIERLPQGIHSRIDPSLDGTLLSGGVRTALAVAQALLIKPSVLLLDEASENVDPAIDAAIFAALERRRGSMTSLIVTHRPSIVRACDALIHVDSAKVGFRSLNDKKEVAV
ncbi:ATP-binding cassette domain-containing protein [uncultured Roseobacter sp.]|uniref:peptidase domain-containing ABC transporter n=1 Tax=uncultured Roseobacter sp. TaxID=114847 RepID=UPI00261FE68C|nr:ATP-binding cassette domain-containing protein [uncultured Roseobacter sp.]